MFEPFTWQVLLVALAALAAASALARLMLARHRELEHKLQEELKHELDKHNAAGKTSAKPRGAA